MLGTRISPQKSIFSAGSGCAIDFKIVENGRFWPFFGKMTRVPPCNFYTEKKNQNFFLDFFCIKIAVLNILMIKTFDKILFTSDFDEKLNFLILYF